MRSPDVSWGLWQCELESSGEIGGDTTWPCECREDRCRVCLWSGGLASVRIWSHCPFLLLVLETVSHYVALADLTWNLLCWPGWAWTHTDLSASTLVLALKRCDSMRDLFWLFWAGICTCNPCWPEPHCVDRWGTQSDPFTLRARMMGHRTFVLKNVLE